MFPLLGAIWFFVGVVLMARQSRKARKQVRKIFPEAVPGRLLFHEKWASGRSLKSIRTAFGGSSRTLEVAVTEHELWLRLSFPVCLLFSGAEQDLLHRIRLNEFRSVKLVKSVTWSGVELEFLDDAGDSHRLQLSLRNVDEFLKMVPLRTESAEHSLLRPADATTKPEEMLLRSAGGNVRADDETLLRPGGDT
jgi:hypothetical protein